MKRFPTILAVMVAAIALLACEKLDNLEPMKNMKAEFNQPADSGDQVVPEEGTLPGEETMPEEGTTPEIDPVPEVKDPVEEFNRMYPDAFDVEWEDEGNYWEVSFEMGEAGSVVECEAIYDKNGNWLCTETELSVNDVPQYVWDALAASEYAGAEIDDDEADYIETPEGNWYVFEIEIGELEFDVVVTEDGQITFYEED